jgi:hypothetical protein
MLPLIQQLQSSITHRFPSQNINSNIRPARIHGRNDYPELPTLTNVSFTIILIKTVQINQMNSSFCAFSTLTTSLNYLKANRGRKAASSAFDGCKRGIVEAEISRPCSSCENGWRVRQTRLRLMIAACRLMRGVVGNRMKAEGG